MKKSALLFLIPLALFALILVAGLVSAEATVSQVFGGFGGFFSLINVADMGIYQFIIVIIIFVMLFAAFGDIISNFTMFSKNVSWIIGGGLAIITALTGGVVAVARVMFAIAGGLGVLSIGVALITAFIAFALLHLGSAKLGGLMWAAKRQAIISAAKKEGTEAGSTIKMLKELKRSSR